MTELEEKFFETFGIKRATRQYCDNGYCYRWPATKKFADDEICRNCINGIFYKVPEITDHILLELVCILNRFHQPYTDFNLSSCDKRELKDEILNKCMYWQEYIKDDVRKLFEE